MGPKFYKKKFVNNGVPKEKTINDLATHLVIVESPSKCEKIESYLGSQYCCISSKGHIRTIDGLKSIDTKNAFEPTFTLIDEKRGHVDWMRNVIDRFSKNNIILASDDDREGEAIAWHICQVFGLSVETTQRIIFHEVTKPALLEAVNNPTKINMDLVRAQHARQVLDILVGYKISPYLWKYIYNSKSNSLSAGRCQTPALRLVYDNEKEKVDNKLEVKYKTAGVFFTNQLSYELNKEFEHKEQVLEFLEKSKVFNYQLSIMPPKDSFRAPPKPFNTSRLLQVATNVLHISPKETMDLCQKLYQSGHITYMRTESSQYSSVFLDKAKKYIGSQYGEKYLGDIEKIRHKEANVPHEAIRITDIDVSGIETTETRLASMYKLIWKNTVESCMADAHYNNIKTVITAPMELEYHHMVEIPVFLGWLFVVKKDINDEQEKATSIYMFLKSLKPNLSNPQWVECSIIVKNKHSHYNEASLIKALEDLGIGRPSTFASIVETIIDRGYVKKLDIKGSPIQCEEYKLIDKKIETTTKEKVFGNEKSKLLIQPTGILTIEFLLKTFERMFSYEYTKTMELELDDVSSGKESDWTKICANCLKEIKGLSKDIKDLSKQVYAIDENHELTFAPYGPVIKHKYMDENQEEKCEFLQIKKDLNIDLETAKRGGYSLDQLLEIKNNCLGKYEDNDLYIKTGKFGVYVEWGENRESIKNINKPIDDISYEDVVAQLSKEKVENNVLRRLDEHMSVRKGKFGAYVFYQRPDMKKPEFYNIKKFNRGFLNCDARELIDWIKETYIFR
jgi:DNA topoisomerase-1